MLTVLDIFFSSKYETEKFRVMCALHPPFVCKVIVPFSPCLCYVFIQVTLFTVLVWDLPALRYACTA